MAGISNDKPLSIVSSYFSTSHDLLILMYTNALIKMIYNVHNKTHAKFQIDQNKGGVVLTKYLLIVQNAEKVRKLKMTITPKPQAQTMYKTSAKFQKDQNKIVGGFALTK